MKFKLEKNTRDYLIMKETKRDDIAIQAGTKAVRFEKKKLKKWKKTQY